AALHLRLPGQPGRGARDRLPGQALLPRRPPEESPRSSRQVTFKIVGMIPRTGLRLAAALLLAALAAAGVTAADRQKFTLAALRRDGVIIPFASFDGRAWNLYWPD